jgi:phage gpG-like protein
MITITVGNIPPVVTNLQGFGQRLMTSLNRQMTRIVVELQSYIRIKKLVGGNPLHQRTGNLSRAITYQVQQDTDGITGFVGVDRTANYGAVHEYGGTFTVREHIAMSKKGNPYNVRAHSATYPQRSFLRSSLSENQANIVKQLTEAVNEAIVGE